MSTILQKHASAAKHNDEIRGIITAEPSWMLRWGNTLYFCILLLIIGLSSLVKYPEVVHASLKIVSPVHGEMMIPQSCIGKVKVAEKVLIRLKDFSNEKYGVLEGHISYISEGQYKDGAFMSIVNFNPKTKKEQHLFYLTQGVLTDAEIITENATILQRLFRTETGRINIK